MMTEEPYYILPHQYFMTDWPTFVEDMRGDRDDRRISRMIPTKEFEEWAKQYNVGSFEILFWEERYYTHFQAANDEAPVEAWSVGFEHENGPLFFKLRWT